MGLEDLKKRAAELVEHGKAEGLEVIVILDHPKRPADSTIVVDQAAGTWARAVDQLKDWVRHIERAFL